MVGSGEETLEDDEITADIDEDEEEDGDGGQEEHSKSQRQGKTFKTIPLAVDSSNETSKIVSLSLLEEKERSEDEARALRLYTRLNRTRLTLSTRLQDKPAEESLDTTTRRSFSIPQRFRSRSTTPLPVTPEESEETEEEIKVESTSRRSYAGLNRLRGRGSTTTTTEAVEESSTEAIRTTSRGTRQPYLGISRRVTTTTTTTEKSTEKSTGNEAEDSETEEEATTISSEVKAEEKPTEKIEKAGKPENKDPSDPEDTTEEPELEAHIDDDDNEIPLEEIIPNIPRKPRPQASQRAPRQRHVASW